MNKDKKNILFIVRIDAAWKGGGDLIQAQEYKKLIECSLVNCSVSLSHELKEDELTSKHWDAVQIFNISRLHENIAVLRKTTYSSLIICPILQPGFSFNWKSYLKYLVKSVIRGGGSCFISKNNIVDVLGSADGFVFLSEDEKDSFSNNFINIAEKLTSIFFNGTNITAGKDSDVKPIDFVCVGRIEPKKRSIETIDLVSSNFPGQVIAFIGALNWYHPVYCLKFLKRVISGKGVYFGKLPQKKVHEVMRACKTLLNLSELEVSPLVDLEALSCNCNVISTIYSYTHLQQSSNYRRVDVKNISACRNGITTPFKKLENYKASSRTWAENSSQYLQMLETLLYKKLQNPNK